MLMRTLIIIPFLLAFLIQGFGQEPLIFQNATPVEPNRYEKIEGNPMLFKDWQTGRIIGKGGTIFPDITLNYNGYAHGFEVKQGDHYIELDESQCLMVEVLQNGDTMRFVTELLPPVQGQWVEQIYVGNGVYCIKHFNVEVSTQVVQNVGNKVEFKRFNPIAHYFFLVDGEMKEFRPKRKMILKMLGSSKEIEKYVDDNGIDIETDAGLRHLLEYYAQSKM